MALKLKCERRCAARILFPAIILTGIILAGCGGSTSSVSVSLTPGTTQIVDEGQIIAITAAVANDSTNSGVTWRISGPGAFNFASSTAAAYVTPFPVTAAISATITATSVAAPFKSASVLFNIVPPPTLTGTVGAGTVNTAYSATATASGGVAPFTWQVSAGFLPAGLSLTSSGSNSVVISGTPTTPGTANFSLQLKDVNGFVATNTYSIVVNSTGTTSSNACGTGTGNESILHGQYAMLLKGFDDSGNAVSLVASFTADGHGNISGGEEDYNNASFAGAVHQIINPSSASYSVGSDNRGCVVLSGPSQSATFAFALGGFNSGIAATGSIIEFDDMVGNGTRIAGILRLQTASSFSLASLSPNFVFGVDGRGNAGNFALAGSFSLSGGAISNGYSDYNYSGQVATNLQGGSGLIDSISASTGRATATYSPSSAYTFNWAIYTVSSSEFFIVGIDPGGSNPLTTGMAVAANNAFSSLSLTGSYMLDGNGYDLANRASSVTLEHMTLAGTTNNNGAVSGSGYDNDAGTIIHADNFSGVTAAIGSTSGRIALSGGNPLTLTYLPIVYLAGTTTDGISGFEIWPDPFGTLGSLELQTTATPAYNVNSLHGSYFFGNDESSDFSVADEAGEITINAGNYTGTEDESTSAGLQLFLAVQPGSFTVNADGTGTAGTNTFIVTNGSEILLLNLTPRNDPKITVFQQ